MDNKEKTYFKNFENVDIFIYSHKPFTPITNNHIFKVLTNSHAESSEFNTDLAIYRDYEGKNISDANLMYNEYTGFFWLKHNYPLKKYIGLNHYRRYYKCYNDIPDIDEIFSKHPIILNQPLMLTREHNVYNNRDWYALWHNVEDFDLLGDIIKQKYAEYSDGFDAMATTNCICPSNLFIMKQDMFHEYLDFAFSVLLDFKKERGFFTTEDCIKFVENNKDKYIKENTSEIYDVTYQARIIGYLAERVLATFLLHGGKNCLFNKAHMFDWIMTE